jgi:ATP-dependent Clp protease protease subunit
MAVHGMAKDIDENGVMKRLYERLFEARTVLIHGEIHSRMAERVVAQLLALSAVSDKDIHIYVHSQGGHVESGDTIHDMLRFVKPRILMVGTGWVASAGAHIFLAAEKEDRVCLPNTRFLLHQPSGGVGGQAVDIGIEAKEMIKMRRRLNEVISKQTGQPIERVEEDTRRNFWMSASEAIEYGLVSKIVGSAAELP